MQLTMACSSCLGGSVRECSVGRARSSRGTLHRDRTPPTTTSSAAPSSAASHRCGAGRLSARRSALGAWAAGSGQRARARTHASVTRWAPSPPRRAPSSSPARLSARRWPPTSLCPTVGCWGQCMARARVMELPREKRESSAREHKRLRPTQPRSSPPAAQTPQMVAARALTTRHC